MILKRTREQKRHDTQAPKNKVDSIRKVVITPSGENAFVILLRGVNDKVYNLIFKTLGIDISGYSHTLDSSAVKHALNRHKNDEVPLTIEHLSLIPDILKNADRIECGKKNNRKLNTIIYMKEYKNRVFYTEEIRSGRRQLAMNTMYFNKKSVKKTHLLGSFQANPQTLDGHYPDQQEVLRLLYHKY